MKKHVIAAFFALGLALYLVWGNFTAKWWLIDDHELFHISSDLGRAPHLNEIPNLLMSKTEVGHIGLTGRFRPSYYLLRIFELSLWGFQPPLWYLSRFLMLAILIFALYFFATRYLSRIQSLIFATAAISHGYWADIFSRLGPAESYGATAIAILLIAVPLAVKNRSSAGIHIAISLAVILAAGTKEHMIFLAAIPIWFLWQRANFLPLLAKIAYLCAIGFAIWVGWAFLSWIASAYTPNMTDTNGASMKIADRIKVLIGGLADGYFLSLLLIIIGSIIIVIRQKTNNETWFRKLVQFHGPVFLLGLILVNIIFYGGRWPTGMRYDFPGILCWQIGILSLLPALTYVRSLGASRHTKTFALLITLVLTASIDFGGMESLRRNSAENAKRTIAFTKFLDTLRDKMHKDTTLIALATEGGDIETNVALFRYLQFYRTPGNRHFFLGVDFKEAGHQGKLLEVIASWQASGLPEVGATPLPSNLASRPHCTVLEFHDPNPARTKVEPICRETTRLRVPW